MQDSNTLKGVLFDMDGTLFGTEEIWYQSELKLMTRFGVHWNRADHAYCVGGPMPRVTNYMLDKLDNKISAEELFSFEMEYIEREFASNPIPWQPGAQELVLEVVDKGIKIALVTASSKHLVNLVNAQINLDIFDIVVCGDDVMSPKPKPDAYLLAMVKLGLNSKNSMAIEDSNSGVRSALAADLHVLCPPSHQIIVSDDKLKLIETLEGIGVNDLEFWNWK